MTTQQHTCAWCTLTFKKLEHAQRHSRTHTLDRPYTCSECSKTFARRDTLNRHARLHTRKPEPGAPVKGRRRRIKPTATDGNLDDLKISSNKVSLAVVEKVSSTSKAAVVTTTTAAAIIPHSPISPPLTYFTQALPSMDVVIERTVTRPNTSDGVSSSTTGPNSMETFEAATVLSRRHSFADLINNSAKPSPSPLPTSFPNFQNERRSTTIPNYFPTFDHSPKSDFSHSSSEQDDSNDGSYRTSIEVESQYPSPAFTSFSPAPTTTNTSTGANTLHHDAMSDLELIFANEQANNHSPHRSPISRQIPLANNQSSYEFDFINSLEGLTPKSSSTTTNQTSSYLQGNSTASTSSSSALTQHQLMLLQQQQLSQQQLSQQLSVLEQLEKDSTPRSTHSQSIPLQQNFFDSFDFSSSVFDEERARQQSILQQQQQQILTTQYQHKIYLQQQALQNRTLLHHQQHHAHQLQQQQLLALTSLQPITQSLSVKVPSSPHLLHSRSRSSTLPSLTMPYLSLSIAPDELTNPAVVSRSRSNTLNSIFPHQPLPTYTYPPPSLSSAYAAASFPSLLFNQHLAIGNELGLVSSPEQILFDAYQRRKSLAVSSSSTTTASVASSTSSNDSGTTCSTRQSSGGGTTNSDSISSIDFFTSSNFNHNHNHHHNDKISGMAISPIATGISIGGAHWSEEEKREGINWLLL